MDHSYHTSDVLARPLTVGVDVGVLICRSNNVTQLHTIGFLCMAYFSFFPHSLYMYFIFHPMLKNHCHARAPRPVGTAHMGPPNTVAFRVRNCNVLDTKKRSLVCNPASVRRFRPQPDQVLTGASSWVRVGSVSDFPTNGGAAVLYGKSQLAVYNVARRNVRELEA